MYNSHIQCFKCSNEDNLRFIVYFCIKHFLYFQKATNVAIKQIYAVKKIISQYGNFLSRSLTILFDGRRKQVIN